MSSPSLPDLRANVALTVLLKRAVRLVQEVSDLALEADPPIRTLPLQHHLTQRIWEAQNFVKALGASQPEAEQRVRALLLELQEAASAGQRDWMSVEQAISGQGTS